MHSLPESKRAGICKIFFSKIKLKIVGYCESEPESCTLLLKVSNDYAKFDFAA